MCCRIMSVPQGPIGARRPEAALEAWFLEIGPLELDACSWPLVLIANDAHTVINAAKADAHTPKRDV